MWWSVEVFKGPLDVALGDMVRGYYGGAKLTVQLFILKIAPGYDHENKTENLRIVTSFFFCIYRIEKHCARHVEWI